MASYQDLGNDKYKIFVDIDRPGKRKRRTKTVTAKSQRSLKRAMEQFVAEVSAESPLEGNSISFHKFVPYWWKRHVSTLHMRTQEEYQNQLDKHVIVEYFGDYKLNEIRAYHVNNFFDELKDKGVGGPRAIYICLASILSFAEKRDFIDFSPMHKVTSPKSKPRNREVKAYTGEQLSILTFAIDHSRLTEKLRIEIKLGYLVFLREAEIAGIRKSNINFNDRSIKIERQLQWDKRNKCMRYNPLKNNKERIAYFPEAFESTLRAYVKAHSKMKEKSKYWEDFVDPNYSNDPIDLLFTDAIGRPTTPDRISHSWLRFIRQVDELPELNFHGLRHSGVSYLLNRGALLKDVQEQAGHSNPEITNKTYNHTDNKKRANDMNLFNDVLRAGDNGL
jgi:integrase